MWGQSMVGRKVLDGGARRTRRRGRALAGAILALALVGAACGGGDDEAGSSGGSESTEPAEIVPGGEVTYALEAESSADPMPTAEKSAEDKEEA